MKSLRLKALAKFVEPKDKVIDIGCDHAYLSIFLVKNDLCQKVIATDINKNALEVAVNNIKKNNLEDQIKTYLSDGLKNVTDNDIDTLIISGMGTSTILDIIKNIGDLPIKKLILQSNNDLPLLRKNLVKHRFYLQNEKIIFENNHFYVIGVYTREISRLSIREILFGKYDSSNNYYYTSLYNDLLAINKKIKFSKNFKQKIKVYFKLWLLRKYL